MYSYSVLFYFIVLMELFSYTKATDGPLSLHVSEKVKYVLFRMSFSEATS